MRGPNDFKWNEEQVDDLRRLYADGHSASQIARALSAKHGGKLSRCAAIGKAHRLGLGRDKPYVPAPKVAKPAQPSTPRPLKAPVVREITSKRSLQATATNLAVQVAHGNFKTAAPTQDVRPRPALKGIDVSNAKPWLERRAGECCFPVSGDGIDTHSCCAPVTAGGMCEGHYRVCHQSATGYLKAAERHPGHNRAAAA